MDRIFDLENSLSYTLPSTSPFDSEEAFRSYLIKKLEPSCFPIEKDVLTQDGKGKIDLIVYSKIYKLHLGIELKNKVTIKNCREGLNQLIRYRKAKFKYRTPTLFCFVTPNSSHWITHRFFWNFGFGINRAPFQENRAFSVAFPPNGTEIILTSPNGSPPETTLQKERAKIPEILYWCKKRWPLFGWEG